MSEAATPSPVTVYVADARVPAMVENTASSAAVGTPLLQLDAVFQSPEPAIHVVAIVASSRSDRG